MKIEDKTTMYAKLKAGEFGNTIPQYNSIEEWKNVVKKPESNLWGVRSLLKSSHGAKLNVPADQVEETAMKYFQGNVNISPMIDPFVTAMLQITWASLAGTEGHLVQRPVTLELMVSGILYPKFDQGWNWVNSMRDPQRFQEWNGIRAVYILKHFLNENSYDDLQCLMEQYPESTIEMSCTNKCLGTIPHRNAVIWEVRNY